MPDQRTDYYSARKEKLLNDFDRTSALLQSSLVARYGKECADTLRKEAHHQYEELIPEIPFITGPRAGALNTFLLISAQELAAFKAMKSHGKPPGEAWELCHEALRLRMAEFPRWKRWVMQRFMFSGPVRRVVARRARRKERGRFGSFEIDYLAGDRGRFDFGVNYVRCGNYEFVKEHGGEQFAPFVCMSDIALSEAMGWGLTRTQTLADGCSHCDFRFKKGAATQISSKTPEVQKTIEKIRTNESEQGNAYSPKNWT